MAHTDHLHCIGAARIMRAADWNNLARCAAERKADHGTALKWPSMAAYQRYQREYETCISMWARMARN